MFPQKIFDFHIWKICSKNLCVKYQIYTLEKEITNAREETISVVLIWKCKSPMPTAESLHLAMDRISQFQREHYNSTFENI